MISMHLSSSASAGTIPVITRSDEDQGLLERSTKKSKTMSDHPEGFEGDTMMEGIEEQKKEDMQEEVHPNEKVQKGHGGKGNMKSYKESLAGMSNDIPKDKEAISDDEDLDREEDPECPEIRLTREEKMVMKAMEVLLNNQGS